MLERHNQLEEGPAGLYALCERLLAPRLASTLEAIDAYPEVRLNPHNDAADVMPAVERAFERVGYRLVAA